MGQQNFKLNLDVQGLWSHDDPEGYLHMGMWNFHNELWEHHGEGWPEGEGDTPLDRAYNDLFPKPDPWIPAGEIVEFGLNQGDEGVVDRMDPTALWISQADYYWMNHPEHGLVVNNGFGGFQGAPDRIIWMEMSYEELASLCLKSGRLLEYEYTRHVSCGRWWYNRSTREIGQKVHLSPGMEFTTKEEWLKYQITGLPADGVEEPPPTLLDLW